MTALRERWVNSAEGRRLAEQVVAKLRANRPLRRLGLPEVDGRVDLRGLQLPDAPQVRPVSRWRKAQVAEVSGALLLQGLDLAGADFSAARLPHLRLQDTRVRDCRFDDAQLCDLGIVRTSVTSCSFARADLRQAVLAPEQRAPFSSFDDCDFSGSDWRGVVVRAGQFSRCDFADARLREVDFNASRLTDCRFKGRLEEVIFHDQVVTGPRAVEGSVNEMLDCDFRDAELLYVEFRGLDLHRIKWPTSPEHLILRHYRCVLERAMQAAREPGRLPQGVPADKVSWEHRLALAGREQQLGYFHVDGEFARPLGTAAATALVRWLRTLEAECAQGR